jgi:hypothetical protein
MRILAGLIIVYLLVFGLGQKKPGRDGADPPPNVPPLPPITGPTPKPPNTPPPPPPVLGEWEYEDTLDNYEEGEPVKKSGEEFCRRIVAKIREQTMSGRKVQRVIITGFADGIYNPGKIYDLNLLPLNCRKSVSSPLDDDELALLRGCVIFETLREIAGESYAGGEGWRREAHDEPDGINKGGKHRKVRVEITFRRNSDERER